METTVTLGGVLVWVAGIGATLICVLVGAAFAFAWRADKQLSVIASELKGMRADMHDHEGRIRHLESHRTPERRNHQGA